jgi:hypothetical protein
MKGVPACLKWVAGICSRLDTCRRHAAQSAAMQCASALYIVCLTRMTVSCCCCHLVCCLCAACRTPATPHAHMTAKKWRECSSRAALAMSGWTVLGERDMLLYYVALLQMSCQHVTEKMLYVLVCHSRGAEGRGNAALVCCLQTAAGHIGLCHCSSAL